MDSHSTRENLWARAFFILILYSFTLFSFSQGRGEREQEALNDFEMIESQNRFIDGFDGLFSDDTTGEAFNLPIGIKKIAGNIDFTLAITKIKFNDRLGKASLLAKMILPENRVLILGADDISISYNGDLVGDVKLSLLSDVPISMGDAGDLIIKGGYDRITGETSSATYVLLDCNGEFIELSIDGEVVLNRNTFTAVLPSGEINKKDSLVKSSVHVHVVVHDWNDIFTEVSLPSFQIKGLDGFIFDLEKATLDLSDRKNPTNFYLNPEYASRYLPLPNIDLWRGLYINRFTITLPEQFKKKNSKERIKVEAERLLIDENGITGLVGARDILPFEQGDASGWSFSVSDFKLELLANNIQGFGFGGQVGIPISSKKQVLDYDAFISRNEYLIRATIGDSLTIDMFGDSRMKLEKTSYMEMKVKDKKFVPRIVLDGQMDINVDGLDADVITFTKLAIGADAPVISVEKMGYGGEIKLNNFPLTISDIELMTHQDEISLAFDAKVNLMKDKLAAGTRLTLLSEYKDNKFRFKGLNLNALILRNAQMGGFTLDGEIRMEKNHSIYGNYFGGSINATFNALSPDLKVGVTAVFGRKDFRYWYVEGNAKFGKGGIPVGPFTINGFTGGVYYKMSPTGGEGLQAYAPDSRTSLGLKAGVNYYIAQENTINGMALFETNFNNSGGINTMKFYGTASIMCPIKLEDLAGDKLKTVYKKAQEKLEGNLSGSFASKVAPNQNGSELAKKVLPDISELKIDASISAYLSMNYDFLDRSFDADFRVMVNVPGGFLRGAGNNNEAGWVKLHLSPQSWYVHAGTPVNPIGLKLGLGPLSLSTKSYFMFGDKLEKAALPPQAILDIFGMSAAQADYMKYPKNVSIGKGVAFGSRFEFDTGDLTFLILYARFMAGMGFDIMLADMSDYACEGKSSPVGMNGWYANGQCYAYLSGEMGVKIKLFFIKKRITILKGATAAMLQARIPNPTWIGGRLAVKLNVLGLIKLNMKMKMSFGNDCKLVRLDGDYSPLDFPIISDLSPNVGAEDIDVFFSPQGTFSMPVDVPFDVEDDEGNPQTYKIALEDFFIKDNKGQRIIGEVKWDRTKESAIFESFEILPPYSELTAELSVNFLEWANGHWQMVTHGGKNARESKSVKFTTGEAPNYIPMTNIEYSYPVVNQKNFFLKETNEGYVQLKRGQEYLFPTSFKYNTKFSDVKGNVLTSDFRYNVGDRRVGFSLPNTTNQTEYAIEFVALPSEKRKANEAPKEIVKSQEMVDNEGETINVDYTMQAAEQILKEGEMVVLDYSMRTSVFNTFADKMSSLKLNESQRYISSGIHSLLLLSDTSFEQFDEVELVGTDYSSNTPLVEVESMLEDNYYRLDIAPIIYNVIPNSPFSITKRDLKYGVPPSKAFPLYDGYLQTVVNNEYNATMTKMLPYVYELPYYYSLDIYEIKTKIANSFDSYPHFNSLKPIVEGQYLFMRQGDYKTEFRYILPGGKKGTRKQINYHNSLDWRK